MKKHRNKIIAAVLIALSLAIAYFWSGSVPDYGKKNGLETSISEQKKTADKQKHTKKNTALSKEKSGETHLTAEEKVQLAEKIAKENSDDKSSGKKGGYLGYFTKDSKNAQFTKEAFKLEKGQVSNVFETPFGYEIVKVTNKKTEQKSLEDSREEIVNRILADKYLDQVNSLREKSDVQRF